MDASRIWDSSCFVLPPSEMEFNEISAISFFCVCGGGGALETRYSTCVFNIPDQP